MPNNAKKQVYKEKEFELYVMWKFLPPHFRGMKKNELVTIGYTDPMILKLIKIKSQTEFAKSFNIKDLGTLTDWNFKIKNENITSPFLVTDFQKQISGINNQIILPNISELNTKLSEQEEIILSLRKENIFLRKKLDKNKKRQKSQIINTIPEQSMKVADPINSEVIVPVEKTSGGLLKKFFKFFQ